MNNEVYEERLCKERHKSLDGRITKLEEQVDEHGEKINLLAVSDAKHSTQIDVLCEKIGDLVNIIKWFIGLVVSSLIGFFFYAIQSQMFDKAKEVAQTIIK